MIIVIAGIKRSFSTGQFNLVRIALQKAGFGVNIHGQAYELRHTNEVDLVKIHPFRTRLALAADHIFLTDRRDEDILASLDRMWGSGDPDRLPNMRKHLDLWRQYTTPRHEFQYSFWMNHPEEYTRRIVELLGVDVDHMEVLEAFRQIAPPEEKQDPETLMFPGHRTSV